MTCSQILSRAYREIFMLDHDEPIVDGFFGQKYHGIEIEYAYFTRPSDEDPAFDIDEDFFRIYTEDGCEGVWIAIELFHEEYGLSDIHAHVGTIKTLAEGRDAWEAMGALAGELTYCAHRAAWDIYRSEKAASKA